MYKMACRDLGMDCDAVLTGDTKDEVKQKAFAHAQEVHAAMFAGMNTPEQMAEMEKLLESKII
jgi:predicted small metal-binding protein